VINNKKILAIIPARGGSKRVLRKNIREIGGKPLLYWSVDEAKKSNYIDRIIVSTDDEEIIAIAIKYGCDVPFKRPDKLATYEAKSIDVVLHAIKNIRDKFDYVVLLQVTSPLRTVSDIDTCISMCVNRYATSVVSVSEVTKSPYWMYRMDQKSRLSPFIAGNERQTRKQDAGNLYQLNGAVYVNKINQLVSDKKFITGTTLAYVMSAESSIDLDTELDFTVLEQLMFMSNTK